MKLIIDISEDVYTRLFDNGIQDNEIAVDDVCEMARALRKGTPLDNNSERAEVQAYFAGQTYGWEQGRKALIDDVKAEIQKKYRDAEFMNEFVDGCNHTIGEVLEILDNIGKGDSE